MDLNSTVVTTEYPTETTFLLTREPATETVTVYEKGGMRKIEVEVLILLTIIFILMMFMCLLGLRSGSDNSTRNRFQRQGVYVLPQSAVHSMDIGNYVVAVEEPPPNYSSVALDEMVPKDVSADPAIQPSSLNRSASYNLPPVPNRPTPRPTVQIPEEPSPSYSTLTVNEMMNQYRQS